MVQYLLFMMSFGMSSVTWYTYLRCSALVFHYYDDSCSQNQIGEFVCLLSPIKQCCLAVTDFGLVWTCVFGTADVVWHSHDNKSIDCGMRNTDRKGCSFVLIFTLRAPHTNFLDKRPAKLKEAQQVACNTAWLDSII
jgi:hypothetical protein